MKPVGWRRKSMPKEDAGRASRENGQSPEDLGAGGWLSVFMKQSGPMMSAAYTLTGGLLGLGLLGYGVDRYFGTSPAGLLVGLLLGLGVGFWELAKVIFRPNHEDRGKD